MKLYLRFNVFFNVQVMFIEYKDLGKFVFNDWVKSSEERRTYKITYKGCLFL